MKTFLARDKNGELWCFSNEPQKDFRYGVWCLNYRRGVATLVKEFDSRYEDIQWEDKKARIVQRENELVSC